MTPADRPAVLFVCVHNAGRSQMAAGWLRALAGDRVEVRSAGSAPADSLNPVAVEAMAEVGIDIAGGVPMVLTTEAVQDADAVITMGCGDVCPVFPGKRYEDWDLEDPAGKGIEVVRLVRDELRARVTALIGELLGAGALHAPSDLGVVGTHVLRDDPRVLGPGLLPTPFTAHEIREATGDGIISRLLVESPDGSSFERVNEFGDCDEDGATLVQWRVGTGGATDGDVAHSRVTWAELQEHAAFPLDRTTRRIEVIHLPIGRSLCLRYDTRESAEADAPVSTFWFDLAQPGMPVRFETPSPDGPVLTTVQSIELR